MEGNRLGFTALLASLFVSCMAFRYRLLSGFLGRVSARSACFAVKSFFDICMVVLLFSGRLCLADLVDDAAYRAGIQAYLWMGRNRW